MLPTMLTVGSLLLAGASHASERPEPLAVAPTAESTEREGTGGAAPPAIEFERGRRRVSLGTGLALGGVGVGVVGAGAAVVGFVASWGGDDALGVPLMVGGSAGVLAGGAMVVGSPFVIASGLSLERRSLAALGATPPRGYGHAAAGSAIGGAALGLVMPPAALLGVAAGVGFTIAQQAIYTRAFESIRVAPVLRPDGGGVAVSGRF